jgi:S-adenosylmethionine:tRNA ribosyltransferase-isomerase
LQISAPNPHCAPHTSQSVDFLLSSYDYELPPQLIAQTPAEPRDAARLLVLPRSDGEISHHQVSDLPSLLAPGDLVVVNRSRVLPCRLIGRKSSTGGRVELLLLWPIEGSTWQALVGGRHVRPGQQVEIAPGVVAEIGEDAEGGRAVRFLATDSVPELLRRFGRMPLPPYITRYTGDPGRYQTVYAQVDGSAAAPTAGLHFTPELIERLQARGVQWASVVLHVGLDTFRPISDNDLRRHHIHTEWVEVPAETVEAVSRTRQRGGRVVAVGTTTVRALEHAAADGELHTFRGPADLFILPGYRFRVIDALLTNFHLPRSSLLLLVSALAGRERILRAYQEAIERRYRFFSFGDAMLIL